MRKRKVDFTGGSLGELDAKNGVFVLAMDHGWVPPRRLFDDQLEPLFVVQCRGFGNDGEDKNTVLLLRPDTAAQMISAIITIATVQGVIDQVGAALDDELRQTTMGGIGMVIKRVDIKEN